MIKTITKQQTIEEVSEIICDRCGFSCTPENVVEWQEFYPIRFTGGYGSVFGDGEEVNADLCQKCLYEILKGGKENE